MPASIEADATPGALPPPTLHPGRAGQGPNGSSNSATADATKGLGYLAVKGIGQMALPERKAKSIAQRNWDLALGKGWVQGTRPALNSSSIGGSQQADGSGIGDGIGSASSGSGDAGGAMAWPPVASMRLAVSRNGYSFVARPAPGSGVSTLSTTNGGPRRSLPALAGLTPLLARKGSSNANSADKAPPGAPNVVDSESLPPALRAGADAV